MEVEEGTFCGAVRGPIFSAGRMMTPRRRWGDDALYGNHGADILRGGEGLTLWQEARAVTSSSMKAIPMLGISF